MNGQHVRNGSVSSRIQIDVDIVVHTIQLLCNSSQFSVKYSFVESGIPMSHETTARDIRGGHPRHTCHTFHTCHTCHTCHILAILAILATYLAILAIYLQVLAILAILAGIATTLFDRCSKPLARLVLQRAGPPFGGIHLVCKCCLGSAHTRSKTNFQGFDPAQEPV